MTKKNFILRENYMIENVQDKYFWNGFTFFFFFPLFIGLAYVLYVYRGWPTEIEVFPFFLISLAVFRMTRLFVYDKVTEFIREYFAKRSDGFSKNMTELFGCPWCVSMWFSLFIVFIYFIHPIFYLLILITAVAGMAALMQLVILLLGNISKK